MELRVKDLLYTGVWGAAPCPDGSLPVSDPGPVVFREPVQAGPYHFIGVGC